jgi:hypothetical protein
VFRAPGARTPHARTVSPAAPPRRGRQVHHRVHATHTYAKQPTHVVSPSMSARADFAKKRAAARGWA